MHTAVCSELCKFQQQSLLPKCGMRASLIVDDNDVSIVLFSFWQERLKERSSMEQEMFLPCQDRGFMEVKVSH